MALRIAYVLVSVLLGLATGYVVGTGQSFPLLLPLPLTLAVGAVVGAALGGTMVSVERALRRLPSRVTVGGGVGMGLGVVLAGLLVVSVSSLFPQSPIVVQCAALAAFLIFPYLGLIVGVRSTEDDVRHVRHATGDANERPPSLKLLDTSVIIDGRIAEICETGFLEGTLVIPQFILQELQHVADSADSLMRARGRRGLDILNHIQKNHDVEVRIVEDDFPHVKEVDSKLVELGKKLDAKILTNDLNLNKVALLQGVRALNINELSNALRPVVLPGETLRVFVLKEGKEAGQGVAYLDDGTMVVVDHAKHCIGKNVDGIVTSVLQTNAGRMIFTRLKELTDQDALSVSRG